MRDAGVVRQAFDYSCGSAALATLLSQQGQPAGERDILFEILDPATPEERARVMETGLTLLDLQRVAQNRGHRAAGYRVPPEVLTKLSRPVLVFVQPRGYAHFAVLRGVRGDRVFLADPARGNVRMPIYRFLDMWLDPEQGKGVVFVLDAAASEDLVLDSDALPQPELMGARQLLQVGNPYVRIPHLRRPLP